MYKIILAGGGLQRQYKIIRIVDDYIDRGWVWGWDTTTVRLYNYYNTYNSNIIFISFIDQNLHVKQRNS